MPRHKVVPLTDLELEIMNIVWKQGSTTVRQIVDELHAKRPLAYTTIQTVLTILTQKGFVEYTPQGRAYVYRPAVGPDGVRRETVAAVVNKWFEGSTRSLILHLIESDALTAGEAAELRRLLDQKAREARKEAQHA
ncbi:MAG: BlaI/MecI/CopY family transcriptional regulator [Candidatus Latescibacteria bacterium]|nr:BlaI/MecI/CopY family transcriptional regulator [Candidatus Latescibacterota bacterium]